MITPAPWVVSQAVVAPTLLEVPLAADVGIGHRHGAFDAAIQFDVLEGRIAAQRFDYFRFRRADRQVDHVQVGLADLAALAPVDLEDFFQVVARQAGARFDQDAAARVLVHAVAEVGRAGAADHRRQCGAESKREGAVGDGTWNQWEFLHA
jgi:hypothetical protein